MVTREKQGHDEAMKLVTQNFVNYTVGTGQELRRQHGVHLVLDLEAALSSRTPVAAKS